MSGLKTSGGVLNVLTSVAQESTVNEHECEMFETVQCTSAASHANPAAVSKRQSRANTGLRFTVGLLKSLLR